MNPKGSPMMIKQRKRKRIKLDIFFYSGEGRATGG
jgi:hypothetical protein